MKNEFDLNRLPPTVSVSTAARVLGVGRDMAYQAVRTGQLPALKFGVRPIYRVPTKALAELLQLDYRGDGEQ